MNTIPPLVVAIFTLFVVSSLPAEDSKSPISKNATAAPGEELLAQRKAALDAAKEASRQAYVAAVAFREKHKIIDPDPVGNGVTLSPKDDPNVAEYLRLKEAHFKTKTEIEIAEDAWYAARPMNVLQDEAAAAEKEMIAAFAKLAEFLQNGEISDPDPDSANSAVRLNSREREIATTYLRQKSNYLAIKGRATKARKALEATKARKTPAADITK